MSNTFPLTVEITKWGLIEKENLDCRVRHIFIHIKIEMHVFLKTHFFIFLVFYDKRLVEHCNIHTTPMGFCLLKDKDYKCFKCTTIGRYVDKCKIASRRRIKRL